jgi:hypothetical protein
VAVLASAGNAPLEEDAAQELMQRLSDAYYRSRGTVTSGLQHAVEALNEALLKQNLRRKDDGQVRGLLHSSLQRRDMLTGRRPLHPFLFFSKENSSPNESDASGMCWAGSSVQVFF